MVGRQTGSPFSQTRCSHWPHGCSGEQQSPSATHDPSGHCLRSDLGRHAHDPCSQNTSSHGPQSGAGSRWQQATLAMQLLAQSFWYGQHSLNGSMQVPSSQRYLPSQQALAATQLPSGHSFLPLELQTQSPAAQTASSHLPQSLTTSEHPSSGCGFGFVWRFFPLRLPSAWSCPCAFRSVRDFRLDFACLASASPL